MEIISTKTKTGAWLQRVGAFFLVIAFYLARISRMVPEAKSAIWWSLLAAVLAAGAISGGMKLLRENPLPDGKAWLHRLHCLFTGAAIGGAFCAFFGGGREFISLAALTAVLAAAFALGRQQLVKTKSNGGRLNR